MGSLWRSATTISSLCQDDGSKDETLDIIQHTAQLSSVTIRVIQNKKKLAFSGISYRLFLFVQVILSSYPIKMMFGEMTRWRR